MTAKIIDGKLISNDIYNKLAPVISKLTLEYDVVPCLIVLLIGEDRASQLYVRNKQRKAESLGLKSNTISLPKTISQSAIISKINELNNDKNVHGILVQLPLPLHINKNSIINAIDPKKDVDGFHYDNVGKFVTGQSDCLVPCTPQGCLHLIKSVQPNLAGKNAVVIGRSNIVGKPMFHLLLNENCTVTLLHSASLNLQGNCSNADIIVSAVGKTNLVKASWVKPGAIVIDVGINEVKDLDGRSIFKGDVDFAEVKKVAEAITPVPGGAGPMTIAYLMVNTVLATVLNTNIGKDLMNKLVNT